MKVLVTIGAVILALLIRSEIVSLLFLLVATVAFLGKVVASNEHESW